MIKFIAGLVIGALVQFQACGAVGERVVTAAKVTTDVAQQVASDVQSKVK